MQETYAATIWLSASTAMASSILQAFPGILLDGVFVRRQIT